MSTEPAPHRVVVHVGAPKSGTTFLQRTLWSQRGPLLEAGVTCPGESQQEMFNAAIEVRERFEFWGKDPVALRGTWSRLCQEARDFEGTTVMSHELLAAATADQAARALAELDGLEVHLVYTARDLARQVMSEWQERVKNGSTDSFAEFHQVISKQLQEGDWSALFWRNHNLLEVLDRWAVGVPPAQVHVVTAPSAGAAPSELWHRFGEAVGFDARRLQLPADQRSSNESLGVVQVAALRRVNEALDGRIAQPDYGRVVKRQFAQRLLVRQSSARPACPPELVAELRRVADTVNAEVRSRGYSVHGDLADLVPAVPLADTSGPDEVSAEEQDEALAAAVADLLAGRAEGGARPGRRDAPAPAQKPLAGWPRAVGRRIRASPRRGSGVPSGVAARRAPRGYGVAMTSGTSGPSAGPRRVFLHVGSPKTGTTFLQDVLWAHKQQAEEQGLLLPGERFADHYLASLDVRGVAGRPEHPPRAEGMWDRLVEEALAWSGTVLVSHELLAAATKEQAERAVAAFGEDTEVHVVLTARDLVRQMSAEWQEHVKHRSDRTFEEFVAGVRGDRRRTSWFWRVQDFADVLDRWGATIESSRVHVVTVPPATSSSDTLWLRFATLLGLDPTTFDTTVSRSNTSLGVEQAELLRRVNSRLGDRLPLPGPYPTVVKNVLAHRVLAGRKGTRLTLDPVDTEYAVDQSRAIADRLAAMGIDVVGELDELVPDLATATLAASDSAYDPPSADVLLDESLEAMAELLAVLGQRIRSERHSAEIVEEMRRAPVRFALVQASERRPSLMKARRLYQQRHRLLRREPGRN